MTNKPRVALVSGFWGQNIGNAFFNVGGKKILQEIFPEHDVDYIQDQPGYRTFHNQSKGNPKKDIGLLKYLDVKYIVLQGPMLTVNFRNLWEDTFKHLKRRGVKIILLSAAMFKHNQAEVQANREFLKQYPPEILCTRDKQTYDAFKDCCEKSYNGIDSAFFVTNAYEPFVLDIKPYITLNFDRFPEPDIHLNNPNSSTFDYSFEALNYKWSLKIPKIQNWFSKKGKWQAYIGHLLDIRKLPEQIGEYLVIRPEHRFNPHITWKVYKHPNAIASDEPFTYFTVYANTTLTLSDRVHACVATLAYGKPAMLFTPSPRSYLFDRLGLTDIRKKPVLLNKDYLEEEKKKQLEFLKHAVASR
ncbi:hypothetical protein BR63_12755 [Thermanaerosceptrum fracticalcis]|uniref:Polysaccharide pyruvyl transferase domain-containing protein n=1 Tax=Thermanaerosceptrum fracticalcis TaxID=1712410 RepID=A0A7G6E4U6_THEFR|nr:polysaccharide pyruvyl transferase family protein [Thermanaerosceptrum fracticalcis]QNB47100.1 hypothetical protein BR63_12755 [Thermanaerosceptrum fracticalcis]